MKISTCCNQTVLLRRDHILAPSMRHILLCTGINDRFLNMKLYTNRICEKMLNRPNAGVNYSGSPARPDGRSSPLAYLIYMRHRPGMISYTSSNIQAWKSRQIFFAEALGGKIRIRRHVKMIWAAPKNVYWRRKSHPMLRFIKPGYRWSISKGQFHAGARILCQTFLSRQSLDYRMRLTNPLTSHAH